ncbi:type II toxin-antitoxin system Phd/YefM family antitoxin [Exiguobacterium aestuarii]|uniref:Antitoxin n=1 Tax=Exiguobacterium aestuarii TaxID=273527 RepID=A0ABW2PLG0_9BACL|nr:MULTISPECIES: type II toxin-antitoxin system Phd/YefM family antitoxin [Exiguobacterium]MCT4785086.1 type II toxin-antitoxin system Phd/YefM family antitoxin [Exiguobacterium aestuarii]
MSTIPCKKAREEFGYMLHQVCETGEIIVVSRKNRKNAIILSEGEYASLLETVYLLDSPKNAEHLLDSIASIE